MSAKLSVRDAMKSSMQAENAKVKDRFSTADAVQSAGGITGRISYDIRGSEPKSFDVETLGEKSRAEARINELISGGKTPVTLNLAAVEENPFNARTFYVEDKVKDRAESLAKFGQLIPVLVCPSWRSPGKFTLVDGHYRRKALQYNGATSIECVVDDSITSDEALYRYSLELNEEREQQSALDNAFAWRRLLESGIASSDEDLRVMGFAKTSKGNVSKTMSLLKLPTAVHSLIQQHPKALGLHIAYEVCQLQQALGDEQAMSFAKKIVDEEMSVRQAEDYRKSLCAPKEKSVRQVSRQYKIKRGDVQLGVLKVSDTGRLQLDVVLNTEESASLLDELKLRFGLTG